MASIWVNNSDEEASDEEEVANLCLVARDGNRPGRPVKACGLAWLRPGLAWLQSGQAQTQAFFLGLF